MSTSLDFYFYSCRRHTPRRAQPSFVISSHFAPRRVLRHAISCFLQYKTTVDVMKILIENSKFRPEPLPWAYDAISSCHLNGKRSSAFYVVFEDMMDWTLQCTYITNIVKNSQCTEHYHWCDGTQKASTNVLFDLNQEKPPVALGSHSWVHLGCDDAFKNI